MDPSAIETLKKVVSTVTEEPVRIEVDVQPSGAWKRLLRRLGLLPNKRTLVIHPLKLGTVIRISKELLFIEPGLINREEMLDSYQKAVAAHGERIARIIALAVSNHDRGPSAELVRFIREQMLPKELMQVLILVLDQMDISSFIHTIVSVRGLNILESPTASARTANEIEASPMTQGSQIAPGTSSEVPSSTSASPSTR